MNNAINEFVRICSETLDAPEPIYEFGAWQAPNQREIAELRPLFKGKKYIGADIQAGPGVDVVLDLHKTDLPSESAGTVLCFETFEHVENPRQAIGEVHRILRADGVLLMSVPMNLAIHCRPDYWRYTPQGVTALLRPFASVLVSTVGDADYPDTVVAAAFKRNVTLDDLPAFRDRLDAWQRRWSGPWRHGLGGFAKLLVPPIVVGMARYLRYGRFWVRRV